MGLDDESTASPTKGEADKVLVNKLADEMGVPAWGLIAIGIGTYAMSWRRLALIRRPYSRITCVLQLCWWFSGSAAVV